MTDAYQNSWCRKHVDFSRQKKTFLNEAAELVESFTCSRRRFIFTLQTLHADHMLVKSSNIALSETLAIFSHRLRSTDLLLSVYTYINTRFRVAMGKLIWSDKPGRIKLISIAELETNFPFSTIHG